ncbi:MAG: hypothetical protein A2284_06105 [Deltaproteobacteria bacterium RIFOXYA12_FULL_61_11]|nr:MAG: hypothetical protein A2284_06105 [Deltaproteobacteria bacterium RIFOXYA12_FULL_61_11]
MNDCRLSFLGSGRRTSWFLVALVAIPGLAGSLPARGADPTPPARRELVEKAEQLYKVLKPEERIGQLLMYGFRGTGVNPELTRYLRELQVGGIILFSSNLIDAPQTARLCREIRSLTAAGVPPLLAVDQEGGKVTRISKGVTVLPGNMALGATRSQVLAYYGGRITGRELRLLGVNMNLAPVVDVVSDPDDQVIGTRSYGSSFELVSEQSSWYIKGLQEEGIIATAKHFPGHGATGKDTHHTLPSVARSLSELEGADLQPFIRAVGAGVDTIMTAHVHYTAFDRQRISASLSLNVLRYLRERLGFEGVVIADALEMGAITRQLSPGEAAVEAILAGNDMVIAVWNGNNKDAVYEALAGAVRSGRIPQSRLHEAVVRILALKLKRGLFLRQNIDPEKLGLLTTARPYAEVAQRIASRSITLVEEQVRMLPLRGEEGKNLVVLSDHASFLEQMRSSYPGAVFIGLEERRCAEQGADLWASVSSALGKKRTLVCGLETLWAVEFLRSRLQPFVRRTIFCSLGSPYLLMDFPGVAAALCSYSTTEVALAALVDVLTGRKQPEGRLPVELPDPAPRGGAKSRGTSNE